MLVVSQSDNMATVVMKASVAPWPSQNTCRNIETTILSRLSCAAPLSDFTLSQRFKLSVSVMISRLRDKVLIVLSDLGKLSLVPGQASHNTCRSHCAVSTALETA